MTAVCSQKPPLHRDRHTKRGAPRLRDTADAEEDDRSTAAVDGPRKAVRVLLLQGKSFALFFTLASWCLLVNRVGEPPDSSCVVRAAKCGKMAEERERVRRQLALDTKRRQRLFEEKAKEREAAEEELVRALPASRWFRGPSTHSSSFPPSPHLLLLPRPPSTIFFLLSFLVHDGVTPMFPHPPSVPTHFPLLRFSTNRLSVSSRSARLSASAPPLTSTNPRSAPSRRADCAFFARARAALARSATAALGEPHRTPGERRGPTRRSEAASPQPSRASGQATTLPTPL